jgi:acyl-CoA synthetase (AMP-forming)/AMP-acid ligase II
MWYPFEATARKWPSHRAIWSRTGIYTYSEVYERACQYGNYFLSIGIKPGDMVAMYILNSPEYMITLLGLWSIGCTASGINYNLASDALVHCIKICGAKYLIADSEEQLRARVQGSSDRIENELGTKIVTLTAELKGQLSQFDASRPADSCRAVVNHVNHPTLIIYTSGTTGMPKAFAWRIERMYPIVVRRPSDFQSNGPGGDTWYDPMPLYHGTGGLMAINALMNGCTLAIGRGFSIRNFWKDVRDSEATIFVYVGETARYLLSAPPSPDDKNHTIRMMFGNGMRPDVWEKFQERFGVPEVCEFFNSTEGMFAQTMYSKSGFGRGSVGHQGWLMRKLLHKTQVPVRIDHETGDIYRDPETGFAVREDYNVGGEILINLPSREAWQGYYEAEEASNKKIIRDVFTKGDMYFRPGDALRRDDEGLWYFMDRLGDTYRWKGENVSTAEVGEVLGRFNGIAEANVYGVTLPNHDVSRYLLYLGTCILTD